MTEELKQKAIEFEKNLFDKDITISDLLIEFATEATKELQKKVDQLQGYLDHDIEYDIEQKNIELQEENERLKKGGCCLVNCNGRENGIELRKTKVQLDKAKQLLRMFVVADIEYPILVKQAEAFLKE